MFEWYQQMNPSLPASHKLALGGLAVVAAGAGIVYTGLPTVESSSYLDARTQKIVQMTVVTEYQHDKLQAGTGLVGIIAGFSLMNAGARKQRTE